MSIGKIRAMQNNISTQRMGKSIQGTDVVFSDVELDQLEKTLSDFDYVLRNLTFYEGHLEKDGYGGLLEISKEMKQKNY